MSLSHKRWLILAAGIAANLCQGMAYTSSVFMRPLGEALQRPPELWSAEWALIFAMTLAFLPVGMLLSGKLADLGFTRLTIGIGACLFGGGLLLAGYGNSVNWLAATLGMMTSLGSGFAYGTVIGSIVRWFPDRRGLASGMAVAAVGLGPIVLTPLIGFVMRYAEVMDMFKIMGIVCLLVMGLAALCITNPPAGFVPDGWTPPAAAGGAGAAAGESLNWKQMIRRSRFWLLYVTYFCGVFAGLLVNGLASPIAEELAGFERGQGAWAVMLFALCSAGGRVLWGFLSDKLGRIFMIALAFVLTAIAMVLMYLHVSTPGFFLPCLATVGLCYGGIFGTFPSLSAESFGLKNAAVNLAILFSSFSLVAYLGPRIIAYYRTGGVQEYPKAFLVAGCIAAIGFILSIIVGKSMSAKKEAHG